MSPPVSPKRELRECVTWVFREPDAQARQVGVYVMAASR